MNELLDACGRRRSPAAIVGFRPVRPPATKGRKFPPDPLTVEDVVALLGAASEVQRPGKVGELAAMRFRAIVVILWRTGIRASEALALEERDLDHREQTIVIRRGKGGRRRIVVMDEWGWSQMAPWLEQRALLPIGQIFCVVHGPTTGRAMQSSALRQSFREAGDRAGIRKHVHPHGLRHTHAVELWREGLDVYTIQNQLGHARLDVTTNYLSGIAVTDVLAPIRHRSAPMMRI